MSPFHGNSLMIKTLAFAGFVFDVFASLIFFFKYYISSIRYQKYLLWNFSEFQIIGSIELCRWVPVVYIVVKT